ncbi:exonuclease subunit SbcD [Pigmentibacter sp. JX0631]|uniref:exonuclease subunit SbcD n=1 Tax=Pigmentibacter sp. JX0631 TaxID=2976982 RepID=UPI002468F2BE|nr:exonuclease subunit SbcD [Pigmentibacter sp. JX0631]WGL60989.1 exonuclease subunit SbcD [Pigmentibacter sp. JX0631]
MKILHTSDWHLGATFEGIGREEDHKYFLSWLIPFLKEQEIVVLIISGDLFDQSQPSAEAQKIYYQFLLSVSQNTKVQKVIIVGGNHDSPTRLDAPAELLKLLDVFIVGGISFEGKNLDRYLCPIKNAENVVELVVVAVPFIHEYKLGIRTSFQNENEIYSLFKEKIQKFYFDLAEAAENIAHGAPIVATGHMACCGSELDDAPQEIHMIGTMGGLPSTIFDSRFSYIALGHIHRAYRVEQSNAYYSGSPIPLSIKESNFPRYVQIISYEKGSKAKTVQKFEVPVFRKIIEVKSNLEEINNVLLNISWQTPMSPILAITVQVNGYRSGLDLELKNLLSNKFQENSPLIAYVRQVPAKSENVIAKNNETFSLKELTAEQVFLKMCDTYNEIVDENLLQAFRSLLNEENI